MIKVPRRLRHSCYQAHRRGDQRQCALLFAQDAYERVAEAFIAGLEAYAARGGDLKQVASVASFHQPD